MRTLKKGSRINLGTTVLNTDLEPINNNHSFTHPGAVETTFISTGDSQRSLPETFIRITNNRDIISIRMENHTPDYTGIEIELIPRGS